MALLFTAKHVSAGLDWQVTTADATNGAGWYSSLAIDQEDRYLIAYTRDYQLWFARSDDFGATWQYFLIDATDEYSEYGYWPSLTVDNDNNYIVAYQNVDWSELKFAKSTDYGETWEIWDDPTDGDPLDEDFLDDGVYGPGDEGWTGYGNCLKVAPNNDYVISYVDYEHEYLKFIKSTDGGDTWTPQADRTIDTGPNIGIFTSLVIENDSTYMISYFDEITGNVYVRKTTDGGETWSARINVEASAATFVGEPSRLAIDNNGRYVIIYEDYYRDRVRIRVSDDGGLTWLPPNPAWDPINPPVGNDPFSPYGSGSGDNELYNLLIDDDNHYHIAVFNTWGTVNSTLSYAESTDGGITWTSENIDDVGISGECPSMALDSSGAIVISYYFSTNPIYRLKVARTLHNFDPYTCSVVIDPTAVDMGDSTDVSVNITDTELRQEYSYRWIADPAYGTYDDDDVANTSFVTDGENAGDIDLSVVVTRHGDLSEITCSDTLTINNDTLPPFACSVTLTPDTITTGNSTDIATLVTDTSPAGQHYTYAWNADPAYGNFVSSTSPITKFTSDGTHTGNISINMAVTRTEDLAIANCSKTLVITPPSSQLSPFSCSVYVNPSSIESGSTTQAYTQIYDVELGRDFVYQWSTYGGDGDFSNPNSSYTDLTVSVDDVTNMWVIMSATRLEDGYTAYCSSPLEITVKPHNYIGPPVVEPPSDEPPVIEPPVGPGSGGTELPNPFAKLYDLVVTDIKNWANSKSITREVAPLLTTVPLTFSLFGVFPNAWMSIIEAPAFLQRLFSNLLAAIGLGKKRNYWGTVFNAYNDVPVNLAVVRMFSDGKLVDTSVTDVNGVFRMAPSKGNYMLQVSKPGYKFPSRLYTGIPRVNAQIYVGGSFIVDSDSQMISLRVPIDPETSQRSFVFGKKLIISASSYLAALTVGLLIISEFLSILFLLNSPSIMDYIMVGINTSLLGAYMLSGIVGKKNWGKVVDRNGKPVANLELALLDAKYKKVIATQKTNAQGNYRFVVPAGNYILRPFTPNTELANIKEGAEGILIECSGSRDILIANKLLLK